MQNQSSNPDVLKDKLHFTNHYVLSTSLSNGCFSVTQLKHCPSLIIQVTLKGYCLLFPTNPVSPVIIEHYSVYLALPTANRLYSLEESCLHQLTHSFPEPILLKHLLCARLCARCLFMILSSSFWLMEGIQ